MIHTVITIAMGLLAAWALAWVLMMCIAVGIAMFGRR